MLSISPAGAIWLSAIRYARFLRLAQVLEPDHRHLGQPKLARRQQPAIAGGNAALVVDQHTLSATKGACYICMSSSEIHTLQRPFTAAGGKRSTFVIWAKNTFAPGRVGLPAPIRADAVLLEG
jgi:hypothetical protein